MPLVSVMQYTINDYGAPAGGITHLNVVPASGTLLRGLPSNSVWDVVNGERRQVAPSSSAISVNDASLSSIPIVASGRGSGGSGGSVSAGSSSRGGVPRPRCVVPNLRHMRLVALRHALNKAHCDLGNVHKPKHVRRHHVLRVIHQSSRPQAKHPAGYPISVTLK